MEKQNNICKSCKTENEPEYIYCKNCGELLVEEMPQEPVFYQPTSYQNPNYQNVNYQNGYNQNVNLQYQNIGQPAAPAPVQTPQYTAPAPAPVMSPAPVASPRFAGETQQAATVEEIDGISVDEVRDFVGKKANRIIPKFQRSELTGSKVGWCWPVAILSAVFGPIGTAIWYFYRKMYKYAFLLLGIGITLAIAVKLMTGNSVNELDKSFEALEKIAENGDINAVGGAFADIITSKEFVRAMFANWFESAVYIVFAVVSGLFSMNIYKKHTVAKIRQYRVSGIDMRYYRIGLAAVGGTSFGMALLGVVAIFISDFLVNIIGRLL